MARSPIQALVDQACGISPTKMKRMQEDAAALEQKQTRALLAIEKNAKAWWKNVPPRWLDRRTTP